MEIGTDCYVTDELYNVTYDLSKIKSDKFYSAGDNDGWFFFKYVKNNRK